MNIDETLDSAEIGPELDALVAVEVMEWKQRKRDGRWLKHGREVEDTCYECCRGIFEPSKYIEYAMEAEGRIEELGLIDEYVDWLGFVIGGDTAMAKERIPTGKRRQWLYIHATPKQRCIAALRTVREGEKEPKFVVRLWDGFDFEWMDITGSVSEEEATKVWNEKTENGTKRTGYSDIDCYRIFPADTKMLYRARDVEP
jgi:hypothetical protein